MAPFNFSNLAVDTTLAAPLGAADLSMTVATASGYPTTPFKLTISADDPATQEIVVVTDTSGAPTLTITRAADGTTAQAHAAGAAVIHAATAEDLTGRILGTREVGTAAPSAGQALVWGGALWGPGAPTPAAHASTHGAAGSDPIALAQSQVSGLVAALAALVPQSRTLTINGVTLDLSADRSWTVAGGVTGSGTTGRIPEWSGATALGDSTLAKTGAGVLTLAVDVSQSWRAIGTTLGFGGNAAPAAAGANWTAIGYNAGNANATGSNWTAIGSCAGQLATSSGWTAIGLDAGQATTTGDGWIALGTNAGRTNQTGSGWTAIGYDAGYSSVSSNLWTAIGANAGRGATGIGWTAIGNDAARTGGNGNYWTALGLQAGYSNNGGHRWVAVGVSAGRQNVSGNDWTAIGTEAGRNATGSRNIFIGFQAGYNETGSDKLYIESSNSASPLIYGDFASDFVRINGSFELAEISTPAAPANTAARLFARDNAGKTELCVRFATGAVAVLAAEP